MAWQWPEWPKWPGGRGWKIKPKILTKFLAGGRVQIPGAQIGFEVFKFPKETLVSFTRQVFQHCASPSGQEEGGHWSEIQQLRCPSTFMAGTLKRAALGQAQAVQANRS